MPSLSNRYSSPPPPATGRWLLGALAALVLAGAGLPSTALGRAEEPPATFEQAALPLLREHCLGCHGAVKPRGGIDLSKYGDVASIQKDQGTWRKVLTQLRERTMPPPGGRQPKPEEREKATEWLAHTLDNVDESLLPRDPGRVLIHRLSRLEYNNTVRDLLGVDSRPADRFPADGGGGGGFDNNADTLFVPPILMERYLHAADEVLKAAAPARLFLVKPGKGITPRAAAQRTLQQFATRAFRRPVEKGEVDRLLRLYNAAAKRGEKHETALRFALKAVLISPNFLFRVERDQPSADPYPVSDHELASRLSYFLWASMPDEELFRLAAAKQLRDPKVLEGQVARMLRDPKARAFADSFAGQWLRVRELFSGTQPDPRRFSEYNDALRDAMYREPVELFHALLQENGSLMRLVDADYTYANEALAKHYGLPGVTGPEFRRVPLADRSRGGVVTMAGVLTVTSFPRRTSPVLRGKWVVEELLGQPVPPPPPGAGGLPADDAPRQGLTFRQRLEVHREKPQCASCHARMDPIGFGLENFDAIGRWRSDVGGEPVDAKGLLATGETFSGPAELKAQLLARKDEFARNVAERMLAYALGRGVEPYDLPTVRRLTEALKRDDYRTGTLVREIVKSFPFQYRKNL